MSLKDVTIEKLIVKFVDKLRSNITQTHQLRVLKRRFNSFSQIFLAARNKFFLVEIKR